MNDKDQIEFQTNISKPYTASHFQSNVPNTKSKNKASVFSSPDSNLLDSQYSEVGKVPKFQIPIPDQSNCQSYEDYLLEISKWKNQLLDFSKTASIPVPVGHIFPRMEPPHIISPEEWSDNTIKRRLIRAFKPESSPLGPKNMISLCNTFNTGESYSLDSPLPEKGLNDSDILYKYHLNEKLTWSSALIPQRSTPTLYSTFEEYEAAQLHWGILVDKNLTIIPPSSKQIGEIMNLNQEGSISLAPPAPPIQPHEDAKPLSEKPITEKKILKGLQSLMKSYNEEVLQCSYDPEDDEIPHYHAVIPDHCHFKSAEKVVEQISQFGVPISVDQGYSLTQRLREERTLFDIGLMAQRRITKRIPTKSSNSLLSPAFADAKEKKEGEGGTSKDTSKRSSRRRSTKKDVPAFFAELKSLVENDVRGFFLLSMSPEETRNAISALVSGPKTLGECLFEKVPLEDIIMYSSYSDSERYLAKFSMIVHYMLQFPDFFKSILQLDVNSLEQFVELVSFSSSFSYSLESIPEEEVNAAIENNPSTKTQNKIESLVTAFRQMQLIYVLYQIIFSASEKYIKFLSFLRDLIHKSLQKVVDLISDDALITKILEDFHSTDHPVHMFSFRIIRTVIYLQFTQVIRIFSKFELIKFMQRGLCNPLQEIQKNTRSLWQLMMHTDTSLALQIQFTDTPPSLMVSMISNKTDKDDIFRYFLLSIVALFKETKTMISFRAISFAQFQGFLTLLSENLSNDSFLSFLHMFLTLCVSAEAIFCFNRKEFNDFINKFTSTVVIGLTKNSNIFKLKCLKVIYRIKFLEPQTVNIVDVWDFILNEMSRKGDMTIDYRLDAWMAFRNALLHQKKFADFIFSNEGLTKKLDAAFTSFDENVVACLIPCLANLASVITKQFGLEESVRDNLTKFFDHLIEIEELVAAKLLMASKIPHVSVEMAKMHSYLDQFFTILMQSENSNLKSLLGQSHFKSNLIELLKKYATTRIQY